MVADELIKQRTNADFVRQVINDESKTALVLDTIDSAIATLGAGWSMTAGFRTLTGFILLVAVRH